MNIKRYIDMAIRREIRRWADDEYKDLQVAAGKVISFLKAYKPKDQMQKDAIGKAIAALQFILQVDEGSIGSIKRTHKKFDYFDSLLAGAGIYEGPNGLKLAGLVGNLLKALTHF